jgi:glycosyltransferase involved in cell wall biosynthesis
LAERHGKSADAKNAKGTISVRAFEETGDGAVPQVTVVMAVYNAAAFLQEAVASILSQTYHDFELIAVDDSSSDISLSILEGFEDPRIRIIRHQTNMGAAIARNDALAVAQGEFIAIMDADDICVPTRLERQVAFLEANPQLGIVGCGVYDNINDQGESLHTSHLPRQNEAIQQAILEQWCFLHSSLMFRTALYETIGGYRKEFEPAEDHDFVLRLLEHTEAQNLEEPLVSYRFNVNGLSVLGHEYAKELRKVAIRLARKRRTGQAENLSSEMQPLVAMKQKRNASRRLSGLARRWADSWYVANRFYEFACSGLPTDRPDRVRRCFRHSLRANVFFVKSWRKVAFSSVSFWQDPQSKAADSWLDQLE